MDSHTNSRRLARACLAAVVFAFLAQAQPSRIVTTFPSVTETVFALGAGDRVVGVSTYCRYPPAVLSLPKIGSYMKPDLEKIALLRPDLVIIQKSAPGLADRLSALSIPHIEVRLESLAEIYSMIVEIGQALGCPERAAKLNADIQARLNTFRVATTGKSRPTVLIIIGRTPGLLTNLISVGPRAYLGELLEIAGAKNALTESAVAYPRISLETVIRLNPDIILDLSMMGSGVDPTIQEKRLRDDWLSQRTLSAVRNGLTFGLTSEILVTPGPRVVEAVQLLRSRISQQGNQ